METSNSDQTATELKLTTVSLVESSSVTISTANSESTEAGLTSTMMQTTTVTDSSSTLVDNKQTEPSTILIQTSTVTLATPSAKDDHASIGEVSPSAIQTSSPGPLTNGEMQSHSSGKFVSYSFSLYMYVNSILH